MTYQESPHKHQSHFLHFLPPDYVALKVSGEERKFGVITLENEVLSVVYQTLVPAFGGYLAREPIYGSPKYCANATKNHRKHLKRYKSMPHLVFFSSSEAAEMAGFRRCKKCITEKNA
jgi:hypothetical protein